MSKKSTFKSLCIHLLLLACVFSARAQGIQVQAHIGSIYSQAFFRDPVYTTESTLLESDTIGNAQFGLAIDAKLYKHLHLRVMGDYWAARTFFEFHYTSAGGNTAYILGNLFNEKINVSVLPEYRLNLVNKDNFQLPLYGFFGPNLSFEVGDNYAETYVIDGGSETYNTAFKPDPVWGWSGGIGINPSWKRVGLLVELRYGRKKASNEDYYIPRVAYEHFNIVFGITFNIIK